MTPLGDLLREAKEQHGASLRDLTVLSKQNDPFRLDTPANHAKAQWFRDQLDACGLLAGARTIHNRGIHYAIVAGGDAVLPDGRAYVNEAACWEALEDASNTARWLGYVDWEKIIDARNSGPIIRIYEPIPTFKYVTCGGDHIELPDVDAMTARPIVSVCGHDVRQPYRLVFLVRKPH